MFPKKTSTSENQSGAFCTLCASFVQRLSPHNFRLFSILMGHQLRSISPAFTGSQIFHPIHPFQRGPTTTGVRRQAQVAAETGEADVGKLRKGCWDANEIRKSREMSEMIRKSISHFEDMHFVNLTVDTVGVYSWWKGYPRRSARRWICWRSGELWDEGLLWAGPWSMESMEPLFVISLLIEGLSA